MIKTRETVFGDSFFFKNCNMILVFTSMNTIRIYHFIEVACNIFRPIKTRQGCFFLQHCASLHINRCICMYQHVFVISINQSLQQTSPSHISCLASNYFICKNSHSSHVLLLIINRPNVNIWTVWICLIVGCKKYILSLILF